MNQHLGQVFVWSLCARMVHWMIAFSFFLALLTSFKYPLLTLHVAFGYLFGIVLIFRLIWGFFGPRYARFETFKLSPQELGVYFIEKLRDRWRKISAGHNPASSWFVVIVLVFGLLIVISGIVLYGVQEGKGVFSNLNHLYAQRAHLVLVGHQYSAYFLLFGASIHITGVLIEQFYHKTHMVFSMISGYKQCDGIDTKVSFAQKLLAYSAMVLSVVVFYCVIEGESFLTQSRFERIYFKEENVAFFEKCGKCHKHYPPFMLPKDSWQGLMEGLENHFGEKITENNITKVEQESIKNYLLSHSAEYSTQKLAVKTLHSLGQMRPLSITKSSYWRESHEDIKQEVFKNEKVKDQSNCFACHKNFEYGIFESHLIDIPNKN